MTLAEQGAMISAPSMVLFEGSVDILQSMILERLKDEDFKKECQGKHHTRFHAIVELLDRKHVFKEKGADLGHV